MATNDKEYQEKIERLKELIGIQLDQCESYITPVVCANASNPESRKQLIEIIVDMCLKGNISVTEAIDIYERTFNPNKAD